MGQRFGPPCPAPQVMLWLLRALSTWDCSSCAAPASPGCQGSSCSQAYVYTAWKPPISFRALSDKYFTRAKIFNTRLMLPHGVGSNEGGKEGKTGEGSKQRLICFPAWRRNDAAYLCIRQSPGTAISAHCSPSRGSSLRACLMCLGVAPPQWLLLHLGCASHVPGASKIQPSPCSTQTINHGQVQLSSY